MSLRDLLLLAVVAATSAAAVALGVRRLHRSRAGLRAALGATLACIGVTAIFAAANLALGTLLVLGARLVTGRFVSIYLVDDPTWLAISLLQGIAWSLWPRAR